MARVMISWGHRHTPCGIICVIWH